MMMGSTNISPTTISDALTLLRAMQDPKTAAETIKKLGDSIAEYERLHREVSALQKKAAEDRLAADLAIAENKKIAADIDAKLASIGEATKALAEREKYVADREEVLARQATETGAHFDEREAAVAAREAKVAGDEKRIRADREAVDSMRNDLESRLNLIRQAGA